MRFLSARDKNKTDPRGRARGRARGCFKEAFFLLGILFMGSGLTIQTQATSGNQDQDPPLRMVDLNRYRGTWYEIARLPNSFQEDCVGSVRAHYTILPSGELNVINSCQTQEGTVKQARALAWLDDPADTRKLKVSFVPFFRQFHLFAGDYWIFDWDAEYKWAIVGSPDRKYLWFLSRQKHLSPEEIKMLKGKAEKMGFDVSRLQMTPQGEF